MKQKNTNNKFEKPKIEIISKSDRGIVVQIWYNENYAEVKIVKNLDEIKGPK